ncbi:7244_t:CDS:2 [Acaulospora colombiana]|uniref:7244_t:CDS:1 n=1 Tax=Acaulospora colombiana TaxID=27376 RepID=A0ACA9JXJ7_9GLOM|nr:7244_t:CDS:2 [Acaulospora colombiana]
MPRKIPNANQTKPVNTTNATLLKFFSPVQNASKKEEKISHSDPKLASFYAHFPPFAARKTVTVAPINRFQHPVSPNFDELVFGNKQGTGPNSPEPCELTESQKAEESKRYLKEFFSKVRPELLGKRGKKNVISIKELMHQSVLTRTGSAVDAMEVDSDPSHVEKMDWLKTGNDKATVKREMTELSVDDTLNLLKDRSRVWMKLLQFGENYRPAYYGIFRSLEMCGTWTKTSKRISGRNPFAKDTDILDYSYDSEAEWIEDEGDECKSDEEEKDPEDEDSQDDDWIVPNGYLSEDEIQESDESFSSPSSPPVKKPMGNDKPKIIDALRPVVIGPIFEEHLGDSDHQLSEYGTMFLNGNKYDALYRHVTQGP